MPFRLRQYDGDGRIDIFAATTDNTNTATRVSLHKQGADGVFAEIAANTNNQPFTTASNNRRVEQQVLGDYNNDGHLDLLIANHGKANELFKNNGDGTFTAITGTRITYGTAVSRSAAFGDYDGCVTPAQLTDPLKLQLTRLCTARPSTPLTARPSQRRQT